MATIVPTNPYDTQPPRPRDVDPGRSIVGSVAPSPKPTTAPISVSPTASAKPPLGASSTPAVAPAPTAAPAPAGLISGATQTQQTGVSSQNNPFPALQQQTYNPTLSNVNQGTETTQGQIASILQQDSPLMQRARALALQQANRRGLVNSSIGIGAAQAAVLDQATQIGARDAEIYAQRALANQAAQNQAGQFNVGENNTTFRQGADIASRFGLQKDQQVFQGSQNQLDRALQLDVLSKQQAFQGAQAQLDRAQQVVLADKSIEAQKALQVAQQNFAASQADLERAQQSAILGKQQEFAGTQSELDRAQQLALQAGQQQFAAGQGLIERQFTAAENLAAREQQAALQASQQGFTGVQAQLDREQQTRTLQAQFDNQLKAMGYQSQLNRADVPVNFANTVVTNLQSQVAQLQADPNLDPEAKRAAIQNSIDLANSNMQWGASFYNTTLPALQTPTGERPAALAPALSTPDAARTAVTQLYNSIGRSGDAIDQQGLDYWTAQAQLNQWTPAQLQANFMAAANRPAA